MRYRKVAVVVVAVLAIALLFTACSSSDNADSTAVEKKLPRLGNDLAGGTFGTTTKIDGGRLSFVTSYSTDYDVNSWRVTKSKTLNFAAHLSYGQGGEGAEVYVEHVHVDVGLMAKRAGLDGLSQDSMDDSQHSGTQPGFLVSDRYPYQGVFVIEGYSQTLISGWGFQTGDYGQSEISQKRLTERNLHNLGVYGNKFSFVYDILVKYHDDPGFHKVAIRDEFVVPLSKTA